MMRIKALNEAVSNDVDDYYINTISTEAQEQIVLNEYNKALKFLSDNNYKEALIILQDLIRTELLSNILKPLSYDGRFRPMFSLKYSCFKNIANINAKLGEYQNAIFHFWEAVKLDDTDVMLWFRIGIMALKMSNLELSCFAFAEGLKRNNNHWPCLDNIITILFAIPDYMNCLVHISIALDKDPSYCKGIAFCKKIFRNVTLYKTCFKSIYNNCILNSPFNIQCNEIFENTFISEADDMNKKWIVFNNKSLEPVKSVLSLEYSIDQFSWIQLGRSLFNTYNYMTDNNLNFTLYIKFKALNMESNLSINVENEPKLSNKSSKITSLELSRNLSKPENHNFIDCNLQNEISKPVNNTDNDTRQLYSVMHNNTCSKEINVKDSILCCTRERKIDLNDSENEVNFTKIINNVDNKSYESNENLDEKEKVNKGKKRRRSSLCFLTQWAWSSNTKRSSRIRTCSKKEYERDGTILEDTFKQIFPPDLLPSNMKFVEEEFWKNSYDSSDLGDKLCLNENENNFDCDNKDFIRKKHKCALIKDIAKYFYTEQEELDVEKFIVAHTEKCNVIQLVIDYLKFLATKWSFEWPIGLAKVFIQLYLKIRKHVSISPVYNIHAENDAHSLNAETIILFCELYTDDWLCTHNCVSTQSSLNKMGIGLPSDDLGSIIFHNTCFNEKNHEDVVFSLRLLWLKANIYLYQGDHENSCNTLEQLLQYMKQSTPDASEPFFKLSNCKYNTVINVEIIQTMLLSIQRTQKFHEIKHLYVEKNYIELIGILKDTFHFSKQLNQFVLSKEKPLDRVEYIEILLDSLWKLEQYEDCYVWAEASLNESWHNYLDFFNSCTNNHELSKWLQIMLYSLEKLNKCVVKVDVFVVKYLSNKQRTRLVRNLVHILCHQLDVLEKSSTMSINTVLPWILLHYILQYEEDKRRARTTLIIKNKSQPLVSSKASDDDDDDDDENIPASVVVLLKAHKFLGHYGLCCINNGELLLFMMKILIPKLNFPMFYHIKQKLKEPLEQIIYCLYGHPAKFNSGMKSKPKYLEEHVKNVTNLTWQDSQLLFEFYKPENFPTFESKKKNDSINADTVILFEKICSLLPEDSDPVHVVEQIKTYLCGHKTVIPRVKTLINNDISYIYYLIADYYFKTASNQFWASAIRYYMLDLCLHPNALDSWAGLAMSTSTQMETWLNNFHPNINQEKYLMNAKIAQKSYQHAVQLAPLHLTIWTEFGNFLYTVHSFCSRLLKQESDSLSMEKFKILETQKEEMLDESKNCFLSANNIYTSCIDIDEPQDERWLYQYMLAKIAEKKNEEPPIVLSHYLKASQLLNENSAQYPKKISHKKPPNLAIEALEIYYRVHASTLKYLEQHEGKQLKRSLADVLECSLKKYLQFPYTNSSPLIEQQYNICKEKTLALSSNIKHKEAGFLSFKPKIQAKLGIDTSKLNSRKRSSKKELNIIIDEKKAKLDDVSHLQLMQDVVALTDDLITEVCKKVLIEKSEHVFKKKDCKRKSHFTSDEPSEKRHKLQDASEYLGNSKPNIKKEKIISNNDGKGCFRKELDSMFVTRKMNRLSDVKANIKTSWNRRDSQESTTTTQTTSSESNNSSSSSSEETSTTDDSSDSSSSSDSDSESIESDAEKKKKNTINEGPCVTEDEVRKLIKYCLAGLEECALRFPEHYKSIYRLAHFYFYSKFDRNILKCKQLLLGTYECQFHDNKKIQGLFTERKNTNFFNGIWRIPIHEIDRPGSFASHMSKCILLLMQVLKETNDSKILIELCIQLRKIPDADKKYLRDNEREQLSVQALTLCLQCLRNRIKTMNEHKLLINNSNDFIDNQINVILDTYHTYQYIKNIQEWQVSELPKVKKLLEEAYMQYLENPGFQGNIFDSAKQFCRLKLRKNKMSTLGYDQSIVITSKIVPINNDNTTTVMDTSLLLQDQKLNKVNGKNRGRPPATAKSHQKLFNKQFSVKQPSTNSTCVSDSHTLANNLYQCTPFIEANILTSMLGSNFGVNMMDSALNYFNQVGMYQNILQQYQNNSNSLESNVNYKSLNSNFIVNKQSDKKIFSTKTNYNTIKERPDISITPVSNNSDLNHKSFGSILIDDEKKLSSGLTIQLSKFAKTIPTQSSSVHEIYEKQCVSHSLARDDKLNVNTAILSKNRSGEQKVSSQSSQIVSPIEKSTNFTLKGKEISLQHKLKKNIQHVYQSSENINLLRKEPLNKNILSNSYGDELKSTSAFSSFSSNNSVSVNPMSSKYPKISSNLQKSKPTITHAYLPPTKSTENINKMNTLSMLSQLQQHSHLEIIPKIEHLSQHSDKMFDRLKMPAQSRPLNISNEKTLSLYELPKCKDVDENICKSKIKKKNQTEKNTVEIITLDD